MTNVLTWLSIIASLWIGREIVVTVTNLFRIRKLNNVIRVECIRGRFAMARNSLMHLALENQIDANSVTFKKLYYVDTMFMRSPTKYSEISATLRKAFFSNNHGEPNPELLAESRSWSKGTKQVILQTSEAMDAMLADYYFFFWTLNQIAKRPRLAKPIASFLRKIARLIEESIEKRNPDVREIRRAQVAMHQMGAA
jgi:hypothetical protein